MPSKQPALPTRKSGSAKSGQKKAAPASAKNLPLLQAQFITLEDGTQVPVKIPAGMPSEQAQGIIEYLKANPEAAKAAWEQAQAMFSNPAFANDYLNSMQNRGPPADPAVMEALRSDEELAGVFQDVQANGPAALQKYWEDTELMSKISEKMRRLQLQRQEAAGTDGAAAPAAAGTGVSKVPQGRAAPPRSADITSLHDAAKWGDVDAAKRLVASGADVDGKNDRGVTPLGVAVGFNRLELVRELLAAGADVMCRDGAGNTALHYAAGYGRKEVAALLLERGAQADALNKAKQRATDVAKLNGERHMVEFLASWTTTGEASS